MKAYWSEIYKLSQKFNQEVIKVRWLKNAHFITYLNKYNLERIE